MKTHRLYVLVAVVAIVLALAGCARTDGLQEGRPSVSDRPSVAEVLEEHTPRLMAIDGVVGTYEGRTELDAPCIKVMVVKRTAELDSQIPKELGGYPVLVEETGEIRAMPDSSS